MRTLVFYIVNGGGEPSTCVATKVAALHVAAERSRESESPIYVSRARTVTLTKAVVLRLMNCEGGYVDTSDEIATFEGGKRTA